MLLGNNRGDFVTKSKKITSNLRGRERYVLRGIIWEGQKSVTWNLEVN